jgi:hypothetical protein
VDRNRLIRDIPDTGVNAIRLTASAVAAELPRLTPRDRHLLTLLDEHKTFTTDQVAALAFGSVGRARNRLNLLHQRGILDRFRHYQRPGSQAWRWTLGPLGAAIIAASRDQPMRRPSTVRDSAARLAVSPTLAHLLAVNGFFVALTAHARARAGTRLSGWLSETQARAAAGDLVRPDGHGVWTEAGRSVQFWLEVDQGTEQLARLSGKLTGYARLAPRLAFPVLFWLPGPAREANLHAHLTRIGIPAGLCVATATPTEAGPAGAVWRVAGRADRCRLADLPGPGSRWRGRDGAP